MNVTYAGRTYELLRYPPTNNRSLRAYGAADALLLDWYFDYRSSNPSVEGPLIYHDRFGGLATCLHGESPRFVASFASQTEALRRNHVNNDLPSLPDLLDPLDEAPAAAVGLLRVPKSLELFELYLAHFAGAVAKSSEADRAQLACGFMTRYFSPNLLKIAETYAEQVTQSQARKKARLLLLSGFRPDPPAPDSLLNNWSYNGSEYRQYYGVFSGGRIDLATAFLLDTLRAQLDLLGDGPRFLDLGCGSGVIANELLKMRPDWRGLALDDFKLATSSVKMNAPQDRCRAIWADSPREIADGELDLVVTNPPFHFGHENNIEVTLNLFRQAARVLRPGGRLIVVANRHLNYTTHLQRLFRTVNRVGERGKFEVLLSTKSESPPR